MAQDDFDRNQDEKLANELLGAALRRGEQWDSKVTVLQAHWLRRIAIELSVLNRTMETIMRNLP